MEKYNKEPICVQEQIIKLQARGLIFGDLNFAEHFLLHNNYFRLRAYTYPFQNSNKEFIKSITFEEIIDLYNFDIKLRQLIFEAIQLIEVSFRTQIAYHYSIKYGKYFYLDSNFFSDTNYFLSVLNSIIEERNRSKDRFVEHHKENYSDFFMPIWKTVEFMNFGSLSLMFKNIKEGKIKTKIANNYGLVSVDILTNWLRCFTILRNICCHHARLWNRTLSKIKIPKKTNTFISINNQNSNKIYAYICCIKYLLNIIKPDNDFSFRIKELMEKDSLKQLNCMNYMGFPDNYKI